MRRLRRASIALIMSTMALGLIAASAGATVPTPTYSFSVGSKGSGNGQFNEPTGMAVDPSGNVWVADSANNRIEKFNSKGEYLCKIGSSGSGNGQFKFPGPKGIAADSAGNVWVTDGGNNRLQKIGPSCEYLSQFGSKGSGNGQFLGVMSVAIDPSGNIWVADGAFRIEKFNSKGEYLTKCGGPGLAVGQFEGEWLSLAADADGNVWAGDEAHGAQEFNSKCQYVTVFNKASSGSPSGVYPWAIAIDGAGNLWSVGYFQHVDGFYPEGEWFTSFGGAGTGAGQFGWFPKGIAAAPDGSLWVADTVNNRVEKWLPGTPNPVETGRAAQLKRSEATLTATINPQGKSTSYKFEYGLTTSFGTSLPATPKSIGSGTSPVAVSQLVDGLKAETTYYYRVAAITESGTTYGQTRHFTTLAPAKAGSQFLINGKTFAELGISEKSFSFEGSLKIVINGAAPSFQCEESGTGTLISTGLSREKVTLHCVVIGEEKQCWVSPFSFEVNGGYGSSVNPLIPVSGEECWASGSYTISKLSGSFQYGSESNHLNVPASATGSWGTNPVVITSNSHWSTLGNDMLAFDTP